MIVDLIQLILIWFGLYLIVNLSLNIEFGYGGIPNFGKHLAVLLGAVVVGGIVNRILMLIFGINGDIVTASTMVSSVVNDLISQNPLYGIGILLLSIFLAIVLGLIIGALFILPSAKLKEDYLGVTLLAIAEVFFLSTYYTPSIIGGYYGASVPDILAFVSGEMRGFVFAGLILLIAFVIYLFTNKLLNTPYGRILRAMRENENVVIAFGRDIMKIRIKTVSIGTAIAAIAGVLFGFYSANVIGTAFTRVEWTFFPFLMVLLGGKGNNKGIILGTLIFVITKVLLETYKFEIKEFLHLPFEAVWLEYIIFGILVVLILYYRPEGILSEKPILTKPIKKIMHNQE
ncbi:branched-chain amino acid ABC transporter permease [Methanotorris igneus]|uniref:ABC-type transporter, integral membrane subunit n=1 Tax=Methanotorris igneus (strain DSM 5666 / JCM 11834 / Kol 5) TaxID=880724 RepID=F6BC43_METIK|nr:branched-chain amino acid ABC transporter permease [Methanotorris igneus]AEF96124.1 ABC-type transporter, integral membrane subunit [Methanotorris igneus Kol 5]